MINLKLVAKGFLMGVAEIIPGVSGGTLALILGIYERLINALSNIDFIFLQLLTRKELKTAWDYIDGNFLLKLLVGMLFGVLSFSYIIALLFEYPFFLKTLFSSLLMGSLLIEPLRPNKVNKRLSIGFVISLALAILLFNTPIFSSNDVNLGYVFFGGFIAICALILPGISGSFILLLLGLYQFMIHALNDINYSIIIIFILGCITGLLVFVRFLKALYETKRDYLEGLFFGLVLFSIPLLWREELQAFQSLNLRIYLMEITLGIFIGCMMLFFLNRSKEV